MREWLCTSKAEMTREAEARSWDETTGNVWHRLAACDHLLDTDSWKHGDPPQGQGISFATATRHLRILRRRIEVIMVTSIVVGRNGTTQIRRCSMDSWTQNGESPTRRDSNPNPPYHVHNRTRCPKTHSQSPVHERSATRSKTDH